MKHTKLKTVNLKGHPQITEKWLQNVISEDPSIIGIGLDAILMVVRRRKPKKTIIHSDQGSQYSSDDWRRFCRKNNLEPSMCRCGDCWDNAVAESFFSSLKNERVKKRIYKNRKLAVEDVSDHIELFSDQTRRHQHLAGVSPDEFEAAAKHA